MHLEYLKRFLTILEQFIVRAKIRINETFCQYKLRLISGDPFRGLTTPKEGSARLNASLSFWLNLCNSGDIF